MSKHFRLNLTPSVLLKGRNEDQLKPQKCSDSKVKNAEKID